MFGGWGEKDQRAEQGQGIAFSFCPYLLWEMEFAFDCNRGMWLYLRSWVVIPSL